MNFQKFTVDISEHRPHAFPHGAPVGPLDVTQVVCTLMHACAHLGLRSVFSHAGLPTCLLSDLTALGSGVAGEGVEGLGLGMVAAWP